MYDPCILIIFCTDVKANSEVRKMSDRKQTARLLTDTVQVRFADVYHSRSCDPVKGSTFLRQVTAGKWEIAAG